MEGKEILVTKIPVYLKVVTRLVNIKESSKNVNSQITIGLY